LIGFGSRNVERKVLAILRIISESQEPLGGRTIARRLRDFGFDLTERTVRYHLKLTDEQGLTRPVGWDGRLITEWGLEEISSALVSDKVGLALDRIDALAFQTTFDWRTRKGLVPINLSLFPREKFNEALLAMAPAFESGICAGDRVVVVGEGGELGQKTIPPGKIGFGTVSSALLNGSLLKSGIPMKSLFGGILQIRNHNPYRFVELVHYQGSSLDPFEIFIRGKMTSVALASRQGNGRILANFTDVPAVCGAAVEEVVRGLQDAGLNVFLAMGRTSEPICEIAVDRDRMGVILIGDMNPIALAYESGIQAENKAISAVVDYESFCLFESLLTRDHRA